MEFLRTPDEQFANLPDFDFEPHYIEINGARMHYVDTESGDETLLMLHGEPSWSFLYRHMINSLKDSYRCIAPDMFGFGRSDKPTEISDHTFNFHYDSLQAFIDLIACAGCGFLRYFTSGRIFCLKQHAHGSTNVFFAINNDMTAVLMDNTVHCGQPHAAAFTCFLG